MSNEQSIRDAAAEWVAALACPVIRRVQAEALREAVRSAETDHEGDPLAHIWDRADTIERGETA